MLGMKTTSSKKYYVTFKSFVPSWDTLEPDLKKGWNFCLVSKLHQAGGYYTTFNSNFA